MNISFLRAGLPHVERTYVVWLRGPMGWREVLQELPLDNLELACSIGRGCVREGWLEFKIFRCEKRLLQ